MIDKLKSSVKEELQHDLSKIRFLQSADENELRFLAMQTEKVNYTRFGTVFNTGDQSGHVYFVLDGIIKVFSHNSLSKEVIHTIVHSGMLFGENSIYGEKERHAIAQSLDKNTTLLKINSLTLKKLFSLNGAIALDFMEIVGNKLRATQSRLESIIVEDARTRVINFLKDHAVSFGNRIGINELLLKHNYTQQDIADFTGTSRQTVTTVLNDLQRSNIITLNRRRILIRDVAQLA